MDKPRILVVDDEMDGRTILSDTLQHYGYPVMTAKDGEEALALAQTAPPDIAVIDVILPGLSGLDVAAQLKAQYPHITTIMLTVLDTDAAQQTAQAQGAFAYLIKPVGIKEVVGVIQQASATQSKAT